MRQSKQKAALAARIDKATQKKQELCGLYRQMAEYAERAGGLYEKCDGKADEAKRLYGLAAANWEEAFKVLELEAADRFLWLEQQNQEAIVIREGEDD